MEAKPRPCMSMSLLDDLKTLMKQLSSIYGDPNSTTPALPFRHFILASRTPTVFNLGGDLKLFHDCIVRQDKHLLQQYAYKCIDLLYKNMNNFDLPITSISLIEGQALGGGFEMALSSDVIIAERSAVMGFPEILFNLFPGMGAFNLLTRRVSSSQAEQLILSGKTYTAEELFNLGIVDYLVDDKGGVEAVKSYIKENIASANTIRSIKKIRKIINPISLKQLYQIVDIWVEEALNLSKKDLTKMERLLYLQWAIKDSTFINRNMKIIKDRRAEWRSLTNCDYPIVTHLGEKISKNRRLVDNRFEAKTIDEL